MEMATFPPPAVILYTPHSGIGEGHRCWLLILLLYWFVPAVWFIISYRRYSVMGKDFINLMPSFFNIHFNVSQLESMIIRRLINTLIYIKHILLPFKCDSGIAGWMLRRVRCPCLKRRLCECCHGLQMLFRSYDATFLLRCFCYRANFCYSHIYKLPLSGIAKAIVSLMMPRCVSELSIYMRWSCKFLKFRFATYRYPRLFAKFNF